MIGLIPAKPQLRLLATTALVASTSYLWTQAPSQPEKIASLPDQATNSAATSDVTVSEDTLLRVRTLQALNSKTLEAGGSFSFLVSEDVQVGALLAIPRGAMVRGTVVRTKKAGPLTGAPQLTLKLDSLEMGGRTYPLYTYQFRTFGTSKAGSTKRKVEVCAAAGAVVGAGTTFGRTADITGAARAVNIVAGTTVGAGIGTAAAAASPGPGILIPAEAELDFYLAAPISVKCVSEKEAARLAEGLHSGGPSLYVRGETP